MLKLIQSNGEMWVCGIQEICITIAVSYHKSLVLIIHLFIILDLLLENWLKDIHKHASDIKRF